MSETMIHYQDFDELIRMISESGKEYDLDLIHKAYEIANEAHGDQRRVSGVPYILHPTSVACILVELGMDTETVVAALLHDVVEDTDITIEDIIRDYGKEIAHLIDGVTKLKKIPYTNREIRQAENVRKMFIAMSDDIRVIIIKLADRLHNMRTIGCMREQKRRDIALETMEVFAPIAHRLGIRAVKEEMEDLSIRYLDPIAYKEIKDQLAFTEPGRIRFIENLKKCISEKAGNIVDDIYIEGRVKSINGIYRKTYMKGKSLEQIYDIFAVRVIVNSLIDCYNILGVVHDIYTPLPHRFKDYISTPKPNMYQSLHTTVIGKEGVPFEVQIRTWEMHHTAEYGIAAHWKYKLGINGDGGSKGDMAEKISWIRQILENQSDDETDILRNIKTDLAPEEVFVFTPKGDILSLPTGATVIDVAYAIHSAVGNRMIGAKVDGKITPIDYMIQTGEIIEILTSKETAGPKRDWLTKVKTSEARTKIKNWFKKECREENIERGKAEIERVFKRNSIILSDQERSEFFLEILKKQFTNLDDFYASIGYGGILTWKLEPRIKELYNKNYKVQDKVEEIPVIETKPVATKSSNGIVIEGVDDMLVNLARCCNPMRGDSIIGYITRGNGVSIHKCSCKNVPRDIPNSENAARWVKARWDDSTNAQESYHTTIEILAMDRTGLLADITNALSSLHIFIHSINCSESKNGIARMHFTITVTSMEHLKGIVSRLLSINDVKSVSRV
ncbi:MAG: bifunctional (p)ppGpp synthetase/guanosine-3',5'-bis(diphosphate) 3'-pyrophosphohydrolase [Acutalibacteraceae bacterium]|nr:bifunctional (p)ppGpp synthetase/guanosine-3',5'-bis(diphosphate) 3'-pyrophosphohydrolase [Acutalibacteraceae bacterium]